jgi:hypothetical protein
MWDASRDRAAPMLQSPVYSDLYLVNVLFFFERVPGHLPTEWSTLILSEAGPSP